MTGFIIFLVVVFVSHQVGLWLIFKKAEQNPLLSLIPVYNYYILIKISNRPWWWVLLLFVPIVQFITNYNIRTDTLKNYGKLRFIDEVLGVMFFSFYLVYLGRDKSAKYIGPCHTEEFKKKHPVRKTSFRDWGEALFFAAVVATQVRAAYIEAYTIPTASMERSLLIGDFLFVSKTHYGVRIPMTPVAFPFAHHTMPLIGGKAYVDFIKFPYYRFPAMETIDNNDIVVFNFPEGDTVITLNDTTMAASYYKWVKDQYLNYSGVHDTSKAISFNTPEFENFREKYLDYVPYTVRPLDKKDNYIKRCIAVGGDTLQVIAGKVYINGKFIAEPKKLAHSYYVQQKKSFPKKKDLGKMDISSDGSNISRNRMSLTYEALAKLKQKGIIDSTMQDIMPKDYWDMTAYPASAYHKWNKDFFGPLWIPKKGATITLTKENYPLYERAIRVYEGNDEFTISEDKFILNGSEVKTYTFKQDYYFMMGDNRDNSADSRYWGFVPHDHVVGKPVFIWLSLDYEQQGFFNKIRWNRLFNVVGSE